MKIHFTGGNKANSHKTLSQLTTQYQSVKPDESDVIVVVGGDGELLKTLHMLYHHNKPFFGINTGKVGFLMNKITDFDKLFFYIKQAFKSDFKPLKITYNVATNSTNELREILAFNDVAIIRKSAKTVHLDCQIDNQKCHLVADGLVISSVLGSTAYNYSAYGPILPYNSQLISIIPLSPVNKWRGAILPDSSTIKIVITQPTHRTVTASVDNTELPVVDNIIVQKSTKKIQLLHIIPYEQKVADIQFAGINTSQENNPRYP